jgi:autotransporter-associated beta strand protein
MNLVRTPESSAVVAFNALQTSGSNPTPQPGTGARLLLANEPVLRNRLIGPWAIVGREFASYLPGLGVGALNATGMPGYSSGTLALATAADNVRIASLASTLSLTSDTSVHTLNFSTPAVGGSLDLAGYTLNLAGQGLMIAPAADNVNFRVFGGTITSGTAGTASDLYLHVVPYSGNNRWAAFENTFADNAGAPLRLVITNSDPFGGSRWTRLSGPNTHTGGTVVNAGSVVLSLAGADGVSTVAVPAHASDPTSTLTLISGSVQLGGALQIATSAIPMLKGNTHLNLNSFYQPLAGLRFVNEGGPAPLFNVGNGVAYTGAVLVNGDPMVTLPSTAGLRVGQPITHARIPAGTYIEQVLDGTTILLSRSATGNNGSATVLVWGVGRGAAGRPGCGDFHQSQYRFNRPFERSA